ncbi:hypothetical protein ACIA5A_06065 [Micromonospora sp. NPDC051300]|uniref:hypothetical protein n=1 Tax=Micromonospora sp. NPDC051300 TaxID=3364286 RepID=UPI00378DA50D
MGRTVTLTGRVRDAAGHTTTRTATIAVPTLAGMDAPLGAEWTAAVANYPGVVYTRDFGAGSPTLLTTPGAGKWAALPANAIMHCSWKGDVEYLATWLNSIDRRVYLTWYHEPMGDVVPATYRATAARVTQILANHPRRRWVLGHGPIVTRYWLDEGGGNPADWAYPGMTHYGIDCYSQDKTAYWPASRMFGVAFGKVRAAYPGIRLWVPEYGLVRATADTSGQGRAQAIRDHAAFIRAQADVDGWAYFNNNAQFPQFAFASGSPEGQAWRDTQTI